MAPYTGFIVALIAIIVVISMFVLLKTLDLGGEKAEKFACISKKEEYCIKLLKGDEDAANDFWKNNGPDDETCNQYGISKPDKNECEKEYGVYVG